MVIKPNLGVRVFWGMTSIILLVTGCFLGALIFPIGLILLVLCALIALFAIAFAFGSAYTRIDDSGVWQRTFFLLTRKLPWNEIERGKIGSFTYDQTDGAGFSPNRRVRTLVTFTSNGKHIYVNSRDTGPDDWWVKTKKLAAEKLGDKFSTDVEY